MRQGFVRLWERIYKDLRLWERICKDLQGETLGEDSQGFVRLWERIC